VSIIYHRVVEETSSDRIAYDIVSAFLRFQAKIEVDSSSDPSNVLLPFFTKTKCLPTQYGGTDTNKGPHYIDSEVEMLVHTYFSGQRDIRELIPDNSEYSFIPLLST